VDRHSDEEIASLIKEWVHGLEPRLAAGKGFVGIGPVRWIWLFGGFLGKCFGREGGNPDVSQMILER
jgi:hypothetical protein